MPVSVLAPRAGERVLDLASGNGIKAAQIASLGAKPVCVEIDKRKIERAKANLKRLGFAAEHKAHDLRKTPDLAAADKVLLDAPCSGTGTLRGNPEIKLRLQEKDVDELAELQREMLASAAKLTTAGGTLLYSVCTLTSKETVEQIKSFLQDNREFGLEPIQTTIPQLLSDYGSFLLPYDGLDGFFLAKLKRHG